MTEQHRIEEIKNNINDIKVKLADAAGRAGRDPSGIQLMAVSKTKPLEDVRAAYEAGQRLFGENRIQEACEKFSKLPSDAELHMIGHLQSNKAGMAAKCASCVQSIDKLSTASELNKRAAALNRRIDFLIEINTSGETSKNGYGGIDAVYADLEAYRGLTNLNFRGLMTIAPFSDDKAAVRKSFRTLSAHYDKLNITLSGELDILSMGMSSDFEIAIEEGSSLIRVGTAIFGSRNY
ncbi:MAG: YggS family pyridoxal phosphate-dependent enzyme [Spirochaetales bacterium]|nr:YggS family pyridoxal phosphate-dependent enzyme [Spirochaetales bacterium]